MARAISCQIIFVLAALLIVSATLWGDQFSLAPGHRFKPAQAQPHRKRPLPISAALSEDLADNVQLTLASAP